MIEVPDTLVQQLEVLRQTHLLEHLRALPEPHAVALLQQLLSVDWTLVGRLRELALHSTQTSVEPLTGEQIAEPEPLVRLPQSDSDRAAWQQARDRGEELLRDGRLGVVMVAGGQGTRLGVTQPKGMFPCGPLSGKSLYQWFCERLQACRRRYGRPIPYAIMTSRATHDETVAFFSTHDWFGLPPDDVSLFQQASLPSIDIATGRVLLAASGQVALSPDGHGGLLSALARAKVLDKWQQRGIETLFYHQVDNPATPLCDPAFLGWHRLHDAEVSTKVVVKRSAGEKMGVVARVDGLNRVIEYSELPASVAAMQSPTGGLRIWAGNTAMHVFQREFLERALRNEDALPFHVARKVVPSLDASGSVIVPTAPNAYKFERFIFDTLPWASRSLVVEGERTAQFTPLKNREGDDSPETVREALMQQHRQWIRAAGGSIADEVAVEISPLVATSSDDLRGRLPAGTEFREPVEITESVLNGLAQEPGRSTL